MKKNLKYILIVLIIISIVVVVAFFIMQQKKVANEPKNDTEVINAATEEKADENILVVNIGETEGETENTQTTVEENPPEPEKPKKDASTLTQEIYNRNSTIGTLWIPKTNLNTQIYSSVTVDELEKMPCFLYTTGGLNQTGVTLFVGHNRRNGKQFSNNKKLEVGDEFYFTDDEGTQLKYTIYSKFITTEDDVSFLNATVSAPVIALSCCTDASDENRIIILGRADEG